MQRLGAALRRRGPMSVAAIAWRALRERGVGGVARMITEGQPFDTPPSHVPEPPAWPPLLDRDGAVRADLWDRWLRGRPPLAPATDARPVVRASPDGAAGPGAADAVHLFLAPGDRPLEGLEDQVRAALRDGAEVVTFDVLHRAGEKVALLLAPGANLPFLAEDSRHYRRGAASGAFLAATHGPDLRRRIMDWAQGRSPADIRAGWRHVGHPLAAAQDGWAAPLVPPAPIGAGAPSTLPGVSAIICTRDKGHLTRQLARQLLRLDERLLAEVVVVSNGTRNPYALATLRDLAGEARVRILHRPEPFNFSRLCNAGVAASHGAGPLLFLNDDIAPVSEDWLETLMRRLVPGTGAVGPLLLYPDERVQHAGVSLRLPTGAGHILRGARLPDDDPLGLAAAARETTCLTGAVLLVDRAAFHRVGGFDEALAISFQDVDLCLKLHQAAWRNVLEPRAVLLHMESTSLNAAAPDPARVLQRHHERMLIVQRWSAAFAKDPFTPALLDPAQDLGLRLRP